MLKRLFFLCALVLLGSAVAARADTIEVFTGSQAGLCCFNVTLDQATPTSAIQVTVTLTNGATFFVGSGSGQHPTFGMYLDSITGLSGSNITNLSSGWTVAFGSVTTNGPALGTFNFTGNLTSNGASGQITTLSFDISGVSLTCGGGVPCITQDPTGAWFVADIQNAAGATGLSSITNGPTIVPEPSSLVLLGTGMLGAALFLRRRLGRV